jgi:hypothetical protein
VTVSIEVSEAILSATSVATSDRSLTKNPRSHSFDRVRSLVLAVVRELPDNMTMAELRDELEIAENQ